MKAKTTWVLIANARTAELLACTGVGAALKIQRERAWEAEPPKAYEDRQGVSHSRIGRSQHRLAPHNPSEPADLAFAKVVVEDLERPGQGRRIDRLVVTAAPHFLGTLRSVLPDRLKAAIVAEKAVDLTSIPAEKLPERLEDLLRG